MAECISNECSIGGVCYAHNQPNPENPCQYCDVTLAQSSWTNAPSTARCDDGLWCTGSEHCSGTGSCVHEFPDGDRCSDVVGACAASACDEQARSCFLAAGTECERAEEQRCVSPDQCRGAAIERRTSVRRCSGSSASCDGPLQGGPWNLETDCGALELCTETDGAASCQADDRCLSWCDQDAQVCWTTFDSEPFTDLAAAQLYCEDGTWGGATTWQLPSTEYYDVVRGCSECAKETVDTCTCDGPPPGEAECFWDPAMGPCTTYMSGGTLHGLIMTYDPRVPGSSFAAEVNLPVRCVRPL